MNNFKLIEYEKEHDTFHKQQLINFCRRWNLSFSRNVSSDELLFTIYMKEKMELR